MTYPPIEMPKTLRGDGQPLLPGEGVVPILKEIGDRRLSIVGTGFYVTRYGLLVTAKHVLEVLAAGDETSLLPSFVCHLGPEMTVYFRSLRRAHLLKSADIGIVQADNFISTQPSRPLENLRPKSVDPTSPRRIASRHLRIP
jgi:hypothetical protein